jgi:GH18 family chitinase
VTYLATVTAFLLTISFTPARAQDQPSDTQAFSWITAYYTVWGTCGLRPNQIDYRAITHIVHQSLDITSNSQYTGRWWKFPTAFRQDDTLYFEQGVGTGCPAAPVQRMLIDSAHANGVKVILGLGVSETEYNNVCSDPVKLRQWASSVLRYARSKGYDGVDVDWEFVRSNYTQAFINMMNVLRDTLNTWNPRGLLTVAVPGWYNAAQSVPTLNALADQVNLMTYDMAGWWNGKSGFNAPIYMPNLSGYVGDIGNTWVNAWLANGLNPAKTGFGVPFYATVWVGVDGPVQTGYQQQQLQNSYSWVMARKNSNSYRWDAQAMVPWLSIPNEGGTRYFVSYDDSTSLTRKVEYARARGLAGLMIFELWRGIYNGAQPLMDAVKKCVASGVTPVDEDTTGGSGGGGKGKKGKGKKFVLTQNYPNPFNPTTEIGYYIEDPSTVTLTVYNLLGQEVARLVDAQTQIGDNQVTWDIRAHDGARVSSGIYVYRLTVQPVGTNERYVETRRMVLMK